MTGSAWPNSNRPTVTRQHRAGGLGLTHLPTVGACHPVPVPPRASATQCQCYPFMVGGSHPTSHPMLLATGLRLSVIKSSPENISQYRPTKALSIIIMKSAICSSYSLFGKQKIQTYSYGHVRDYFLGATRDMLYIEL